MKKIGIEIKGIKAISIAALFLIIVGAGWFYWYEWRPSQIRKECGIKVSEMVNKSKFSFSEVLLSLDFCLKKKGLEK